MGNTKVIRVTVSGRTSDNRSHALRKARQENPGWTVMSAIKEYPEKVTFRVMMKKKKKKKLKI